MSQALPLEITDVLRADFRTTKEADERNTQLQKELGLVFRYQPARMALARSLAIPQQPDLDAIAEAGAGKAIKGENLFGQEENDLAIWLGLIVEHAQKQEMTRRELQDLVAAHWRRGIDQLWLEWQAAHGDLMQFVTTMLERTGGDRGEMGEVSGPEISQQSLALDLLLGEIGTDVGSGEPVRWRMNGRGVSPHVAIMGSLGTGKTRLANALVRQAAAAGTAVILFDLGKGDLANDRKLVESLDATVVRAPDQEPVPLDVLAVPDRAEATRRTAALNFRDSFATAATSRLGAVQRNTVLEAIDRTLRLARSPRIQDIADELHAMYAEAEKGDDVVTATFDELNRFELFAPKLSPTEFFQRSWIIDLHEAPESLQRLVVFLILDAANLYLKRLKDSRLDAEGNREMRFLMMVDEAHKILRFQQPSLIEIVRTSRSKGGAVMLVSQSPDDFQGQEENFIDNLGLTACFATNASPRRLRTVLRADVDLAALPKGVFVTRLQGEPRPRKILAWS